MQHRRCAQAQSIRRRLASALRATPGDMRSTATIIWSANPRFEDAMKTLPVLFTLIAVALELVSCTKPADSSSPVGSQKDRTPISKNTSPSAPALQTEESVQPRAFKGQRYSSIDNHTVITMISSDELEIAEGGVNIVCKYTRQDDVVRAVINTLGTTQALYYRITPDGLQDKESRIFYSPTRLEAARQQAAAARQQAAEQARINALQLAEQTRLEMERQQEEARRQRERVDLLIANLRESTTIADLRERQRTPAGELGRIEQSFPQILREVKPQYTSEAMRAKIQGSVVLEVLVKTDGTVGDVQVVGSLDSRLGLDQQAINAAKQWRFRPGTMRGEPVPVILRIELTFTLR